MPLDKYRKKRNFTKTPEPVGVNGSSHRQLHFVIQKHDASHLHYDFRLECEGVLKSWAVPKGISMDPHVRRLAMQVEDHPWEYRTFEGIIPAGNYGAGTVIIWDRGSYYVDKELSKKENEKKIKEGLAQGNLKFFLNGKKLHGRFALVRMKGRREEKENAWLLLKKEDEYANQPVSDERSVKTGRNIEEVAARKPVRRLKSDQKNNKKLKSATSPDFVSPAVPSFSVRAWGSAGAVKAQTPEFVAPMLATLTDAAFDHDQWIFEVKWDGYRAITVIKNGKVNIFSRARNLFNETYPEIVEAFQNLPFDAVFDGEIVIPDDKGVSQFQLLQNYQRTQEGNLIYYVFDVLHCKGFDLRKLPLSRRKEILRQVLPKSNSVRFSDHFAAKGIAFYEAARKNGLEGIMAKNVTASYQAGRRSRDWLKVKIVKSQEAVIGGFTQPRGSRKLIGALVLGVYPEGSAKKLKYVGHTGGGFNDEGLKHLHEQLKPLITKECPFEVRPKTNTPVTWVKPELLCEVKFQEWTQGGHMRQPIFLGLREDKNPKDIRRERPEGVEEVVGPGKNKKTKPEKSTSPEAKIATKAALTNLDKVFWPEEGHTKGDVIRYYQEIASVILPYLKDRPQSLKRHPHGINGEFFFQKDFDHATPDWVKTVPIESESGNDVTHYILCQDKDTLAYINNLGCIEINVWCSTVQHKEYPDFMVFDLDPEGASFQNVIEVAQETRKLLDELEIPGYCKTSGSRGLHVYVPLAHRYSYDQIKDFSQLLCMMVHERVPELTSLERSPKNRKGLVYLDYLQNHYTATMAVPYSLRPKPKATVSTPLEWREVTKKLDMSKFTIQTMPARIAKKGDLWKGVLGPGIDMAKILSRIEGKNHPRKARRKP